MLIHKGSGFRVTSVSGLCVSRNGASCSARRHLGWFGFLFSLPRRDIAPLGEVPITGSLCYLCECVFGGGGGYGAGPILLGTHVLQYQALSASPACQLQGWLEQPWSNLLCFLTPVKLYSEVCVYVLVPYTQNKTSCLRRHFPCSPVWSRLPPHPHPSLSFISEEEGDREVFGVWSPEGREGGASESSSSHLFLPFKMEAYEHV